MLFSFQDEITAANLIRHGLRSQPFSNTALEANHFYLNNTTQMLINGVSTALQQSTIEVCIIKGETGMGKSSLANYIHKHQHALTSFIYQFKSNKSLIGVFQAIINDEKFHSTDIQHLAKHAAIEIFHNLKNDIQPVLIIDDAYLMNEKTFITLLRFLKAIKQQGVGSLKLILCAEKSIERLIEAIPEEQIHPSSIYTVLMRPFNATEVQDYLRHKCTLAGCMTLPLNKNDVETIIMGSGGIPGLINTRAAEILNRSRFSISSRMQLGGYIAAGLIFTGLIFSYVIFNTSEKVAEKHRTELNIPSQQNQHITEDNPSTHTTQQTHFSTDEPSPVTTEFENISSEPHQSINDVILDTTEKPQVTPPIPNQLQTLEIDPLAIVTTDKPLEAPTKPIAITPNTLRSHRWLAEQNRNDYMLQLLGTENYQQLIELADTVISNCTLAYFLSSRNQAPWHVLLCGPYKDSQSAIDDVRNLPEHIQKNKPWVRKISTIQANILQN